jgi:lipid-A-disaccharide synthase
MLEAEKGVKRHKVVVVAGEASGDLLGSEIITALQQEPGFLTEFSGVGGAQMMRAGHFESLFPMEDLSVMGLSILPSLPKIWRRFHQIKRHIQQVNPDAVITIDSPEFCLRLQKALRKGKHRKVHIVAPSVWAWRPGRAKKVARYLDHLGCLFPFEPPYFKKEGLKATFLGHPLCERIPFSPRAFPETPEAGLLLLMPGSRESEVQAVLPLFLEAARALQPLLPKLKLALLTLPHLRDLVETIVAQTPLPHLTILSRPSDHARAFQKATQALVASGTATLELALYGIPMVVAYKISWVMGALLKRILRTPYVALPNIILQKEVVPELLQENCTAKKIEGALKPLLMNANAWKAQYQAFQLIRQQLKPQRPLKKEVARFLEEGS